MSYIAAILSTYHKANTFINAPTTIADFRNDHLTKRSSICSENASDHHKTGGLLDVLNREKIEAFPFFFTEATQERRIITRACAQLLDEIFQALREVQLVDAYLLVPHEAAVSEKHAGMDGYWLPALRKIVDGKTPIIDTLSPHSKVSNTMITATDASIAHRTNPHNDQRHMGTETVELLVSRLKKEAIPCQHLLELPPSINIGQQYTSKDSSKSLYALVVKELRNNDTILSTSINLCFPYADARKMGRAVIIITNNQPESTQQVARHIKKYVVDREDDFEGIKINANTVMSSLSSYENPVLMLDIGDNVEGGTLGNSTVLLDAVVKEDIHKTFIAFNADHFADFVIEAPTPIMEDKKEVSVVYHYSKIESLPVKNTIFALGNV